MSISLEEDPRRLRERILRQSLITHKLRNYGKKKKKKIAFACEESALSRASKHLIKIVQDISKGIKMVLGDSSEYYTTAIASHTRHLCSLLNEWSATGKHSIPNPSYPVHYHPDVICGAEAAFSSSNLADLLQIPHCQWMVSPAITYTQWLF